MSLQRDSNTLRIHDIQQANSDSKVNMTDSMVSFDCEYYPDISQICIYYNHVI